MLRVFCSMRHTLSKGHKSCGVTMLTFCCGAKHVKKRMLLCTEKSENYNFLLFLAQNIP